MLLPASPGEVFRSLGVGFCHRSRAIQEQVDDRAQHTITQGDHRDGPARNRQLYGQYLQSKSLGGKIKRRFRHCPDKPAGCDQIIAKVSGVGRHAALRQRRPPSAQALDNPGCPRRIERRYDPWLIGQLRDVDLAPARPPVAPTHHDAESIVEQDFRGILRRQLLRIRCRQAREHEIELALAQFTKIQGRGIDARDDERDARVLL